MAGDAAIEAQLHAKSSEHNIRRHGGGASKAWCHLHFDILTDLMRAQGLGFVVKNADAFEIAGYDTDAIPEYLGGWDWATLELEECRPFCGMHFQDASQIYRCLNCDTLTDFSDGRGQIEP